MNVDDENTELNDENLLPTNETSTPEQQNEPGQTNRDFAVPEEQRNAGNDTNIEQDDSPETLDQELSEGVNREDIDPHHSIPRPEGVDTLDKEEYGAD
jgi:hypothetical protein